MMQPDSNVGFILEEGQRQRVKQLLDGLVDGLPHGYSVLIDRAGRIVEVGREPVGVQLEAISALAAGCFAVTHEMAVVMGEEEYSLLFKQEDDQQVYIWPVVDRALLVVLLRTSHSIEQLEERLGGPQGRELMSLVGGARMPERAVPPPRVVPAEVPFEVRLRVRALTSLVMDLQARRAAEFTEELKRGLLKGREELLQAVGRQDWRKALGVCEWTRQWLAAQMKLPRDSEAGKVVPALYSEVFECLHGFMKEIVPKERLTSLYRKIFMLLARKRPRVFVSDSLVTEDGLNAPALWERAQASSPDTLQLAREFIPAMDDIVREILRVIYLARGPEGRKNALERATSILVKYRDALLPLGLEGIVGASWTLLSFK